MDHFEEQLKDALRRETLDAAFSARVLARLNEPHQGFVWWRLRVPQLRWAVATALVIVLGLGVYRHQEQRRRDEGEAARQQVMVALRIAGTKIRLAQTKVLEMSQR